MQSSSPEKIFPRAYASTQELGLQFYIDGVWGEPFDMIATLEDVIPPQMSSLGRLLNNGSYLTPISDTVEEGKKTNLAIMSPECSTPEQLHAYLRAAAIIVTRLVERYAVTRSEQTDSLVQGRIQNRVVDGGGSRKGARDSFALPKGSYLGDVSHSLPPSLIEYCSTRGFIVGAGHNMGSDGLRYAQKTDGLKKVAGAGFFGSMFNRVVDGKVTWLESRNNDANISDWATRVRIGGTAIMLALNHTPLGKSLNAKSLVPKAAIARARQMNILRLTPDGNIEDSAVQRQAVAFQRMCMELFMDKLQMHTEVPDDLYELASEIYKYCDDYELILDQEAGIAHVADRADWAAKFDSTIGSIDQYTRFGIHRSISDPKSVLKDITYDLILVRANGGKRDETLRGKGYKLRDDPTRQHPAATTLPPRAVQQALSRPPQTTRASILHDIVGAYPVAAWGRSFVRIQVDKDVFTVEFPDPLQTELTPANRKMLEDAKDAID